MKNESWRSDIDPMVKDHLEAQIKETARYKKSYEKAKNKADAQLWIAVANLSRQLFNLNLKLNYLERALKDSLTGTGGVINLGAEKAGAEKALKKGKIAKSAEKY